MNNHQRRLLLGFVIAVLVLTALFLLLTKTPLVITAFCFAVLALIMFFGSILLVASGTKSQYITNVAFLPLAYSYAGLNLIFGGIFALLSHFDIWTMPVGWFIFIHILLIAFFAWRLLAMDSGREEIKRVEDTAQRNVRCWKMIGADVEALRAGAPDSCRKCLQDVADAIRYADPMTCPELESLDEAIRDNVRQLGDQLKDGKTEEVSAICQTIQRQIKDRSNRAKLLK